MTDPNPIDQQRGAPVSSPRKVSVLPFAVVNKTWLRVVVMKPGCGSEHHPALVSAPATNGSKA